MTRWLDDHEQQVWRSFLTLGARLDAHLARRMQADGHISMADFAVLVPLSEAPDGRLRAFALSRALQWEKSRLSHHLTRMERRGLVTREDCGSDRRGAFVVLTAAGREALEAAAPRHVEVVREAVFDRLTEQQVAQLGEVCEVLLAGLDRTGECAPAERVDRDGPWRRPAAPQESRSDHQRGSLVLDERTGVVVERPRGG